MTIQGNSSLVLRRVLAIAAISIGGLSMGSVAQAGNYSLVVTITAIGCQTVNGICFATVSGAASGPSGCVQNQVRWDSGSTPNGNAAVAQLTAAYLTGKTVIINLDNNCFSEFTSYPAMDYYIISD